MTMRPYAMPSLGNVSEATRPMIPAARFINETVFGDWRELAKRAIKIGARGRDDMHLPGLRHARLRRQHALPVLGCRYETREHLWRLDSEQYLRASLPDLDLLRREQQRHQIENEIPDDATFLCPGRK